MDERVRKGARRTALTDRDRFGLRHIETSRRSGTPATIYAAEHGLSLGAFYKAKRRLVRRGAVSPDPRRRRVSSPGFAATTPAQPGHVFRTDNATDPLPLWADVSPPIDLPANVVAVHPDSPEIVYVGTDLGAWVSGDGGATWQHVGPKSGLPNVPVLDIHVGSCAVTAFTYGRGAFRHTPLFCAVDG